MARTHSLNFLRVSELRGLGARLDIDCCDYDFVYLTNVISPMHQWRVIHGGAVRNELTTMKTEPLVCN